ncbi:MAG TPA: tetratricopeptide repeat protein [Candidatus Polarisedimenticolia bacterium]|nr:tetratricopeptide repeat protein [Candidatus Polarisedimenticolia bacterium]
MPEVDLSTLPEATREKALAAQYRASQSPEDPNAVGELGMRYFAHAFPAAAAACLERAAALDPKSFKWIYYTGLAYERANETASAVRALEKAIEMDGAYGPALVKLGNLVLETDTRRAADLFTRAIKLNQGDAAAHLGLGRCARLQGRTQEALSHYMDALERVPDYAEAHYAVAMILASTGDKAGAQEHLRRHAAGGEPPLAADPLRAELVQIGESSFALRRDAARLAKSGRMDEAEGLLERAIQTDVSGVTAHRHLGILLAKQGRFEQAAAEFRLALKADPADIEAKTVLGLALTEMGESQEAERLFREVLERHPDDAEANVHLGRLLSAKGLKEEALDHLRRGVSSQPSNALFQYTLGESLAIAGNDTEAMEHLRKSVALQPERARAHYLLGLLLAKDGRMDEASAEFAQSVKLAPDLAEGYLGLAGVAIERKDAAAAVRWSEKACELTEYSKPDFLRTLAEAYEAAGRQNDAAKIRARIGSGR